MEVATVISAAASLLCTLIVGALTFFLKKTLTSLEEADKKNAQDIRDLESKFNDLKADLPLTFTAKDDFIRIMNNVEKKLDLIYYKSNRAEKEE